MIDYSWISENFPDSDFLIDNPTHLLLCDMQSNSSFIPKICLWSTYFYFKKSTIPGWIVQIYLCSIWSVSQSGNPTLHEHISYIINSSMGFCYTYKWQIDLINLLFHILNCDKRIQKYRQSLFCWNWCLYRQVPIDTHGYPIPIHGATSISECILIDSQTEDGKNSDIWERWTHLDSITVARGLTLAALILHINLGNTPHSTLQILHTAHCTSTWVNSTLHTAHQAGHNAHLAATLHTTHYYCH